RVHGCGAIGNMGTSFSTSSVEVKCYASRGHAASWDEFCQIRTEHMASALSPLEFQGETFASSTTIRRFVRPSPHHRLVLLVAPSGGGKTAVLLDVAKRMGSLSQHKGIGCKGKTLTMSDLFVSVELSWLSSPVSVGA